MASERRYLERQRREMIRTKDREKLGKLRSVIKTLREHRKRRLVQLRAQASRHRHKIREDGKRWRKRALEKIRDELARERKTLQADTRKRAERIRQITKDRIERQKKLLAEERRFQAEIRRAEQRNRRKMQKVKATHKELARESDDQVRANLPEDLVPVFDKVKTRIKGTNHASRTEKFLEWAEENPTEVWAIREAEQARELDRLVREHHAHERKMRKATPRKPGQRKRAAHADLSDIPF